MSHIGFLVPGDWNATCSMCGHAFKASELRKHWQGFYRCKRCWESRQPQDFVRGVADNMSVPWDQPWTDTDITAICTLNGMSAIPGWALPDCSIPDRTVIDPSLQV